MTIEAITIRLLGLCTAVSLAACVPPAKNDGLGDVVEDAPAATDEDADNAADAGDETGEDSGGEDSDGEESDGDQELPPRAPPPILEGACEAYGELSECTELEIEGVQFCHPESEGWGPCVFEPACELGDVQSVDCGLGGITELSCYLQAGVPEWEECGFTPLVLSFDGREPVFDAGPDVFELSDGSNTCLAREWPGPQTPWLAIDLDKSGSIENGRELFGSASPTSDGRRPTDGFDALRELDDDHDGRITPADAAWGSLLLWSDLDRDRASSPMELTPVWASGLTEIELQHRIERRCDAGGNCGIELSAFAFSVDGGAPTAGTVIDVHIPCD